MNWKCRLTNAYSQAYREIKKDSITYALVKEDEEGFLSSVSSENFAADYSGAQVHANQKLAEEEAAIVAMQAEFPTAYAGVPEEVREAGAKAFYPEGEEEVAPVRRERKAPAARGGTGVIAGDKVTLNNQIMTLVQRHLKKEDIEYTVSETSAGMQATVKVNCFTSDGTPAEDGEGEPQEFTGEVVEGTGNVARKLAENSAAIIASETFLPLFEAKKPEIDARNQAKKDAFEARIELLKSEGKIPEEGRAKKRKTAH